MDGSAPKIYIAKTAMITPLGTDTATTAAAIDASISRYEASQYKNTQGDPMTLAQVPQTLWPELKPEFYSSRVKGRHRRMVALAAHALTDLMSDLNLKTAVPLFLATSESLPTCAHGLSPKFIQQLAFQTDMPIDIAQSRVFTSGRAGGIEALASAVHYIQNGGAVAIVGGVDSFIYPKILGELDREERVLAQGVMDGAAFAEAAGLLLLVPEQHKKHFPDAAHIIGMPATAQEPGHRYSDEPMMGEGLSQAFKHATSLLPDNSINTVYASFNGESFHSKEFGIAMTRNSKKMTESVDIAHPADAFGDIGAAFVPVMCALATTNDKSNINLVYSSSDNANRGAVIVLRGFS